MTYSSKFKSNFRKGVQKINFAPSKEFSTTGTQLKDNY